MTFQWRENRQSRPEVLDPPSKLLSYYASGENDDAVVFAYALANTPVSVPAQSGLLRRQSIELTPRGFAQYQVDVPYAPGNRENGTWTWDFDTGGGTIHITTKRGPNHRGKFVAAGFPGNIPDAGAIGERDPDQIDGVDIIIPALIINVHFQHPKEVITIEETKRLARLTGKVNNAAFLTFEANEILFLGARGSDGSEAEAKVTYSFAASENEDNLQIGDIINIAKKGHDVLWVKFKPDVDQGRPVQKPEIVYVDQVYAEVDLATELGFG